MHFYVLSDDYIPRTSKMYIDTAYYYVQEFELKDERTQIWESERERER